MTTRVLFLLSLIVGWIFVAGCGNATDPPVEVLSGFIATCDARNAPAPNTGICTENHTATEVLGQQASCGTLGGIFSSSDGCPSDQLLGKCKRLISPTLTNYYFFYPGSSVTDIAAWCATAGGTLE